MPHFVQCFSQLTKPLHYFQDFPLPYSLQCLTTGGECLTFPFVAESLGYNPLATRKPRTNNLPHHDFHEKSERSILRFHDIRALQFIFKVTEIGAIIPCLNPYHGCWWQFTFSRNIIIILNNYNHSSIFIIFPKNKSLVMNSHVSSIFRPVFSAFFAGL